MRLWEKYLNQTQPNNAKIWAMLGALFDVAIIMGIVLTMFWHSCEICYTTNSISGVYESCEKTTNIFEHGYPWDFFKTQNSSLDNRSIGAMP